MSTVVVSNETERLAELEAIVDRGIRTFVEVGRALAEIRDGRLYKSTYRTFEAYVNQRWGLTRGWADKQIAASRVVANADHDRHFDSAKALLLTRLEPNEQKALARVIEPLSRDQAYEVVRRYRENGTALKDVNKLAAQVISADAFLQFLGVMRDVLGLSTMTPDEIFVGASKAEIAKSITSVANAAKFLRDCERVMKEKA